MHAFRTVAAWALLMDIASAFQSIASNRMPSPPALPRRHRHRSRPNDRLCIVRRSTEIAQEEEEEYEAVEFVVTPEQISFLRKESVKRETRKKLTKFFLPQGESTEVTQETVEEISNLFAKSELIQVRGVSKDRKKQVFDTAHGLAATLEYAIEKPVVIVDIKGFAVTLYCPWAEEEEVGGSADRIQLRTSYRPGQWTRKAKPIRDNRGQIILDESGKSIKEIPE